MTTTTKAADRQEFLDRLRAMVEDRGETWDLSPADQSAIKATLALLGHMCVVKAEMLEALKYLIASCPRHGRAFQHDLAKKAIARAEGLEQTLTLVEMSEPNLSLVEALEVMLEEPWLFDSSRPKHWAQEQARAAIYKAKARPDEVICHYPVDDGYCSCGMLCETGTRFREHLAAIQKARSGQ